MNKNIKKVSIILVTLIILIVGIIVIVKNLNGTENEINDNKKTITISIYNKENENIYNENIDTDKQYLFEIINEKEELQVVSEDSQYGKYITSIMGIEQGDNYYWSYYIDGQYAEVGVSNCKIENGKTYEFKIENMNY